jgi:hypothetical protein
MRTVKRILLLLLVSVSAAAASASTLTISAKHDVLVTDDDKKRQLRVLFADEQLFADITLNVYVLDQLPSTRAHYDDLRKLTDRNWLEAVSWSLVTTDGAEVALPTPAVLSTSARQRGPAAVRDGDRDTAVPMTTYRARVAFGSIPAGDYILRASVRGLSSSFRFVVRTGSEPGLQDHYLRLKALRTRDYAEFRRLQLERLERNPARLDALYDLIDRALVHGTLEETRSYFDREHARAGRQGDSPTARRPPESARVFCKSDEMDDEPRREGWSLLDSESRYGCRHPRFCSGNALGNVGPRMLRARAIASVRLVIAEPRDRRLPATFAAPRGNQAVPPASGCG